MRRKNSKTIWNSLQEAFPEFEILPMREGFKFLNPSSIVLTVEDIQKLMKIMKVDRLSVKQIFDKGKSYIEIT